MEILSEKEVDEKKLRIENKFRIELQKEFLSDKKRAKEANQDVKPEYLKVKEYGLDYSIIYSTSEWVEIKKTHFDRFYEIIIDRTDEF